jgi:sugar phosphate permease
MAVKLIKDDGGSSDDVQNIEDATTPTDLDPKADKKLLRRLDLHVLPWLCLLYALSLFDRNSISTAKIVGLVDDLKLVGNHYSVALLSFFPTYILIELPANTLIRKFGPKRMLTCMIICWGTVAMCFGFVNTFSQLIALRVLLGIFEGGFNVSLILALT